MPRSFSKFNVRLAFGGAFLLCLSAPLAAQPTAPKDQIDQDSVDVNTAMNALQQGKFALTVEKAEGVIRRFEATKKPDSAYRCTGGSTDTLLALAGAALGGEGTKQPDTTYAISDNICTAYFLKGFALVDLKRHGEALPFLMEAVKLDPDSQHYLNEVGEWHKTARDWKKSLEIFTLASETTDFALSNMADKAQGQQIINEMRCRSYRGIAFNQAELKNWDAAREALTKCLKLIPGDKGSLAELAYIKEQTGE